MEIGGGGGGGVAGSRFERMQSRQPKKILLKKLLIKYNTISRFANMKRSHSSSCIFVLASLLTSVYVFIHIY